MAWDGLLHIYLARDKMRTTLAISTISMALLVLRRRVVCTKAMQEPPSNPCSTQSDCSRGLWCHLSYMSLGF